MTEHRPRFSTYVRVGGSTNGPDRLYQGACDNCAWRGDDFETKAEVQEQADDHKQNGAYVPWPRRGGSVNG
ncbi:DUF6349 family protein [Streptosporangium sp. 'caverna']|uniref:DUF6349 family protein n=1 Tax=Streptosporangium sp. 'caverna' TaxID=2202249 RepID=UPI000D7DBCBB|nr:DUF6349 family protein [Streptosporangium sp. 'caverna']AWS44518.1 hypothetical protein DKM19_27380 [Streptosporangium sp. 'caverna']